MSRWQRWLTAIVLCTLPLDQEARAWTPATHAAAVQQLLLELSAKFGDGGQGDESLVFKANGHELEVQVTRRMAYDAIVAHPDYFTAGVIGPDAFPDPLSGQFMAHGNETALLKDLTEAIHGVRPPDHAPHDPIESRHGPAEFRSIDFATAMLLHLDGFDSSEFGVESGEQIIAFIMGYVSHGVGDNFAHTWVNLNAGGAWSLTDGEGLWGKYSEEVKHVAMEKFVEDRVPAGLLGLPGDHGGRDLISVRAPEVFLDSFYSAQVHGANTAGPGFKAWMDYYSNLNRFHGGPFYNYLNAQVSVAPAMRDWSGLGDFFDVAEKAANSKFIRFLIDTVTLHDSIHGDVIAGTSNWIADMTGGFINCHLERDFFSDADEIHAALDYLGGVNMRVDIHSEKARIIRRNWIRLSECTSENLAKTMSPDFDPSRPEFNRDACADVVRAGWMDEVGTAGLYRGSIRPGRPTDSEFLRELKAAFLGGDPQALFAGIENPEQGDAEYNVTEAMEHDNEHRLARKNADRMLEYLRGFAFRGDELLEVVFPEDDQPGLRERYENFCETVRDDGFERCINLALGPLALEARRKKCQVAHAECVARETGICLKSACYNSCRAGLLSDSVCSEICGTGGQGSCKNGCDDVFCHKIIFGIEICVPFSWWVGCRIACNIFDDEHDSCFDAALATHKCGVESVVCKTEALLDTITLENHAEYILEPIREVCDTVDEALDFVDCIKGDPNLTPDEQAVARRECLLERCESLTDYSLSECTEFYDTYERALAQLTRVREAVGAVADLLRDRPAHEQVNLAFLKEDLQEDPAYLESLKLAITGIEDQLLNNPPDPNDADAVAIYERKLALTREWKALAAEIEATGTSDIALFDFEAAADEATRLVADSLELGLIPSIHGPTVRRILAEIGDDFSTTFTPFRNTVAGMKLAPLAPDTDLMTMFEDSSVSTSLLAAANGTSFSDACSGTWATPYCDVITSFDDPNCSNCEPELLEPDPNRHNWVPGRGVSAFNELDPHDPAGTVGAHVHTSFPLASYNDAYDRLYTRVFTVPTPALPDELGPLALRWADNGSCVYTSSRDEVADGYNVFQLSCGSSYADRYTLQPTPDLPGFFTINSENHPGDCLNAGSDELTSFGRFNVYHHPCLGNDDEQFALIPRDDGRFELQSYATGLCLHASDTFRTDAGLLEIYQLDCDGSEDNLLTLLPGRHGQSFLTAGAVSYEPDGNYFTSEGPALHEAWLFGPEGADYDLYLYKWDPTFRRWRLAASSFSPTNEETIRYEQGAGVGYFIWMVRAYSGQGAYEFWSHVQ